MPTVAVIQARMSSSRLPGKVTLPLGDRTVLGQVVQRVRTADTVDAVVVAAPDLECDDVVSFFARRNGAAVHRGPHEDVLKRLFDAADQHDAETVVRVSADSPLVMPRYIDHIVTILQNEGYDYVTSALERTFPLGVTCETFTFDSFRAVEQRATTTEEREHVTTRYRESAESFDCYNVVASEVSFADAVGGRTDLRFTLDRAADYDLLRRIFENINTHNLIDITNAVRYVEDNNLRDLNAHIRQR